MFFYLALQYKKNNLIKLYKHNLFEGLREMQYLSYLKKARAYAYALYVILWVKYLSPVAYYNKGRLTILQLIASFKGTKTKR